MRKNDITKEISQRLNMPKYDCDRVIETFAEVVRDAIARGEKIKIRDFITFEISNYKARQGYNPSTGETMDLAPTRTVKCKVGKMIRDAVKEVDDESITV